MKAVDFVKATIGNLHEPVFSELKKQLLGEFVYFSVLDEKTVTVEEFAEKICDYFRKLTFKTGKEFDKVLDVYLDELNAVVSPHIAKAPQAKRGDATPVAASRARRYYDKFVKTKDMKKLSVNHVLDYSRVMFCLYVAALKNGDKPIENFDYSAACIDPGKVMDALRKEEVPSVLPNSRKKRFDTKDRYSTDSATLVLSAMVLSSIANRVIEGDSDHE